VTVRVAALRAVALVAVVAAGAAAASARELPANDGWVTDLGGFLTPEQERELEALAESYKAGSGNEIAVLTVPDLGGRPIERYALEVARAWGIGEKDRHNGALLVVARDEREMRIEVGRGLEGTLTDSISGRIIRDVIVPDFKSDRTYEGLLAGLRAMHAAAGADYAAIPNAGKRRSRAGALGALIPLLFLVLLLRSLSRRGGGSSGAIPWLLLGAMSARRRGGWRTSGWRGGGGGGGGGGGSFGGFGGGGGFSGGGASGGW